MSKSIKSVVVLTVICLLTATMLAVVNEFTAPIIAAAEKEAELKALREVLPEGGSFTELVRTVDHGQVSVNISKPGITKGNHWHNSKWELFIVVSGHGLIQERNINTGETVEFEVSGDKIEAIHMIPGWTHNIINLSETENLVTVMTCNELFDPARPDTFFEKV